MGWKDLQSELSEMFGELSFRDEDVSEKLDQACAKRLREVLEAKRNYYAKARLSAEFKANEKARKAEYRQRLKVENPEKYEEIARRDEAWKEANPDYQREYQRMWYAKLRADPVRWAEYMKKQAESRRKRKAKQCSS